MWLALALTVICRQYKLRATWRHQTFRRLTGDALKPDVRTATTISMAAWLTGNLPIVDSDVARLLTASNVIKLHSFMVSPRAGALLNA